uniref:Uncharacterized protein n=1 Tax=Kalanchoe fedtschenkoi TaxID=63787 RepID=A0A7N0UDA3_KALFE
MKPMFHTQLLLRPCIEVEAEIGLPASAEEVFKDAEPQNQVWTSMTTLAEEPPASNK